MNLNKLVDWEWKERFLCGVSWLFLSICARNRLPLDALTAFRQTGATTAIFPESISLYNSYLHFIACSLFFFHSLNFLCTSSLS